MHRIRTLLAILGVWCAGCNDVLGIESAGLERSAMTDGAAGSSPPDGALAPSADAPTSMQPTADESPAIEGPAPLAPAAPVSPVTEPAAPTAARPDAATEEALPGFSADAGARPDAPPGGPPLGADGLAIPLPDDLPDAPVTGEIIYSEEATWEVDGVFRPTFEVHTPTGSYWIVESLGTMVSMQDAYAGRAQWIDFSSGFRPLRNIPAFATPPAGVRTVLDGDSQTPTHLRLISGSADAAWQWVWDIYITHVTLTINRAPVPVGFSYRGVPAGLLGTEDQLVQSDGTAQSARNSFSGELPGPAEWVYFADTAAARSLFLVQHTDDALPERYQVRDNDSAMWIFGDGAISALPMRFSLGLLDGVEHARVAERVLFVASAIR
jgi:hypothetical protein